MLGRICVVLALLGAAVAAASGCGGNGDESTEALNVRALEYAYDMPDRGSGGVTTFNFSNPGGEAHEFALGRLAEGRDLSDVRAYIRSGADASPKWLTVVGGTPSMSPHTKLSITRSLDPGRYVFLCFLPSPQGIPHANLGMVRVFDLEGDSGRDLPEPDAVITATDRGYDVPPLEPGRQTIELKNGDDRAREFVLFTLKPGKTIRDLGQFFEQRLGPAPAIFRGGMQTIPPGTSVDMGIRLKRGVDYTLADNTGAKPVIATFTPE